MDKDTEYRFYFTNLLQISRWKMWWVRDEIDNNCQLQDNINKYQITNDLRNRCRKKADIYVTDVDDEPNLLKIPSQP